MLQGQLFLLRFRKAQQSGHGTVGPFGNVDLQYYLVVHLFSREYHEGCMLERDRFLVERFDCLLAIYDGEQQDGTAMTVRYAKKLGREIIVLNPQELK